MQSKKTLSILVTAILALSIVLVATPIAKAQPLPEITSVEVLAGQFWIQLTNAGDSADPFNVTSSGVVRINVTAVYPTSTIKLSWDGDTLASQKAYGGKCSFVITLPEDTAGDHIITVYDSLATNSTAWYFRIWPTITLSSSSALPGDTLTVSGKGFAPRSKINVTLIDTSGAVVAKIVTTYPTTTDKGSFSTSARIPTATTWGTYAINASDAAGNEANATIKVGSTISLSPIMGEVGATITINGRGFIAKDASGALLPVYIRWYHAPSSYATLKTLTPNADGTFSTTITCPSVPDPTMPTPYKVQAFQNTTCQANANFLVIKAAGITLNPKGGKVGTTVTVTGTWFMGSSVTIYFGTIAVAEATVVAGSFTAQFEVPEVTPGTYTVKATDNYGVSATASFTVQAIVIDISIRSTTYTQGDTITFTVKTTEQFVNDQVTLTVTDPEGYVYWHLPLNLTQTTPGMWTLPYSAQVDANGNPLRIPDDAITGTWTWNITYTVSATMEAGVAKGTFTVKQKATLDTLSTQLSQLNTAITQMTNTLGGKLDSVGGKLDSVQSSVSGLSGTISGVSSAAQTAASAAQTAASAAQTAASASQSAAAAAEAAKTAAEAASSTAQNAVTAANAAKSAADSASSAANEAVSAAEAAKAAAEGIALPVWIAVVLSLVAAVAAIFAIITIRGKIAG